MTEGAGSDRLLSRPQVFAEERALLLPNGGDEPLAALCLSGGGIRSATFALGVMQALARHGLLGRFHYLSTVSGGGYIGGWLTAWRARQQNDAAVFAALDRARHADGAEAPQLRELRRNSNYLTPRLGILSPDSWALAALILRNLALNWLVFGPLFLGALLLPKAVASLLAQFGPGGGPPMPWLFAAAAASVFGLAMAVHGRLRASGGWLRDARFLSLVGSPLAVAAVAATFGADMPRQAGLARAGGYGAAAGLACHALAWGIGFGWWRLSASRNDRRRADVRWRADLLAFMAAGLVAGAALGAGLRLSARLPSGPAALLACGPAWGLVSFAIGDVAFVGLNSFAPRGEQDREWLARHGGWLLAIGASLAVICGLDFTVPAMLRWTWGRATAYLAGLGLSGAVTLLLGSNWRTAATGVRESARSAGLSRVASIAALAFAACLAGGLSVLDDELVCAAAGLVASLPARRACALLGPGGAALWQAGGCAALALLAFAVSFCVNVNRFSLHALYRNRLVRTFLGAARAGAVPTRAPDPFSGFDPDDNPRMHRTLPTPGSDDAREGIRLLHVVNMALNVTATGNLAWQERKAEPFTVTALHAGNGVVGYRPTRSFGGPGGGITLGTAMAISGAAVSPNAGYHSSPLVGMLLSLFNLRLGWWLGNPRRDAHGRSGPAPGLWPALAELAGRTDDRGRWIALSDGGHFENLGLYEMVARGCRRIVVSDAGCDPEGAFEDLGNAARKIYIDLGVAIDFKALDIPPRGASRPGFYCAVGTIRYPGDGGEGWLLYVKPGYHGGEPIDVRSYAMANAAFPHESTAEQWFGESQFEAYRALGAHIVETICAGGVDENAMSADLDGLFEQAKRYLVGRP